MEAKVKVIVKRPDEEFGHVTNISTTLTNLRKTVEGHIEPINIEDDIYILMNQEGKIEGLDENFWIRTPGFTDHVVGIVCVCRINMNGDLIDLPDGYFKKWKGMLWAWGNN